MPGVTWNPNVLRLINLVDSEEIQPVRNVPHHLGSQDIEKSQIRTHKVTRTYLGEIIFRDSETRGCREHSIPVGNPQNRGDT